MANIDWTQILEWKSADQLVALAAQKLQESNSKLTNWNKLSRLRTLVECLVQPTAELFVLLLKIAPQVFARYATGVWLELHAQDQDDERLAAQAAQWLVRFTRADGGTGNITIEEGTRIGTLPDANGMRVEFVTTTAAVLTDGDTAVDVEATAAEAGSSGNVGPNTAVVMINPIGGVAGVTNVELMLPGTDQESDEALRDRLVKKWDALGYGSNRSAYETWALSVVGVRSAWVDDDHPRGQGTVDVYVVAETGVPTENLLSAVDSVIQTRRTVCANVQVKAPAVAPITITGTIYIGPSGRAESTIEAEATSVANAYFYEGAWPNVVPIGIAEDWRPARMVHLLMHSIADVVDVALTSNANVAVGDGELAVLAVEPSFSVVRLETL